MKFSKIYDKLDNAIKLRPKKPTPGIKKALMLIKTNTYNPLDKNHQALIITAIREGYLDKEHNIIKEVK